MTTKLRFLLVMIVASTDEINKELQRKLILDAQDLELERKLTVLFEKKGKEILKITRTVPVDSRQVTFKFESDSRENDLYPNASSVKIFRTETNEISWKDPDDLIPKEQKEKIECCLRQKGRERANLLFDCISKWYVSDEAKPFVKELMFAVSKNVDVDKRGGFYNESVLMYCIDFDAEEAVHQLIHRGAKTKATDALQSTALHKAAINGRKKLCEVLLQRGANVNAQSKYGTTALMIAAYNQHVEVVKLLLDYGAETKIKDIRGRTALDKVTFEKPNCADLIKAHEEKFKITNLYINIRNEPAKCTIV